MYNTPIFYKFMNFIFLPCFDTLLYIHKLRWISVVLFLGKLIKYRNTLERNINLAMRFLFFKKIFRLRLRIRIESKRKDMYKKANDLGFTHPEVVHCSQELDDLLNKYSDTAA